MQLLAIFLVGLCGHAVFNASRMLVSLFALQMGAGPAAVGMLAALNGVLPVLLGLSFGRLVDRVGVRAPLIGCALVCLVAVLAPFAWPSYASFVLCGLGIGMGFVGGLVATSKAVAALSSPAERAGRLGWLAAASSLGGALAPVATGFAVDHLGHRTSFALLALLPLLALVATIAMGRGLPGSPAESTARSKGAWLDLWRAPGLRMLILLSAAVMVAIDTFMFLMPIIGSQLGWSASITGVVVGSAIAAVVLARVLLPVATRLMAPWTLLGASYLVIAAGYLILPLIEQPGTMIAVAFLVGAGTGVAPPVLASLLYSASPAGRQGEVIGLRTSVQFGLGSIAPVVVGALGALIGLAPVLWVMGAGLAIASRLAFRERRTTPGQ